MTVTLVPNQYPAGTLAGSPIQVVNTYQFSGNTQHTTVLPIPSDAMPGDVMLLGMGWGTFGTTAGPGSVSTVPGGVLTGIASYIASDPGGNPVSVNFIEAWYHVVRAGESGTTIALQWSGFYSWALVAYCLRYVDTQVILDVANGASGSGTIPAFNTATGPIGTALPNALCVGFISASGGTPGLGLSPGPLTGWYNTVDPTGGTGGPNHVFVSGLIPMPVSGVTIGAGMTCQQNNASVPTNSDGIIQPIRPTPAPGAPSVTMSPSGSSIDMAGVSGVLPTVSWNYSPARGQGPQNGWGIARQRHTVGDMVSFWNADTNTWQASQYVNYGTRSSFTFPTGAWANDGTNWDLFVFIQESALDLLSALSAAQTFVASPPTATVTVTGPTGTTALPKPAVTWTRSLGSGATQAFYRVKVFTQAQTLAGGFDPNVTVPVVDSTKTAGSVLTWTLSKALVPGVYVAYAQLTTNFGQATLWTAGSPFTVAYSQPTAAGVTALVGAGP